MAILLSRLLPLLATSVALFSLVSGLSIPGFDDLAWPDGRPLPVKITRTPSGGLLAWVRREDQGEIATPPPLRPTEPGSGMLFPDPELSDPKAERGPPGTVPFQILTKKQAARVPGKVPPPELRQRIRGKPETAAKETPHYYGTTRQYVDNYGGRCYFSLFKPNVTGNNDESLLQIGEFHDYNGTVQSAEAGWQVLPSINNGDYYPHVFSYYTTSSYLKSGDKVGCYNTLCQGFIQTSDTYYPGMTFRPYSTIGGNQYSLGLFYVYNETNWWLNVNNHYLGYYPGDNYRRNGSIVNTLAQKSNDIEFYGEITDDKYPTAPRTDMGSGRFAKEGFGKAAYMRNLTYVGVPGGPDIIYVGKDQVNTPQWYTLISHYNTSTSYGSYFYVGGPGAA